MQQHDRHAHQQSKQRPKNDPNTKNANSEWSQILGRFWTHIYSQGWVTNLCVGIALGLFFVAVPLFLKNPKAIVLGAIAGLTILLWIFGAVLYRAIDKPQPIKAATSISVCLLPNAISTTAKPIPVTSAMVIFQNASGATDREISIKLKTPAMRRVQLDDGGRIKLIGGGGENASYVHLLVPELVPDERRTALLEFAPVTENLSAEAWARHYGYPKSISVYRLRIGPPVELNTPKH